MTALNILQKYISFFEKRGHARIANSPLVPIDDPTTLFTSSGMQPLVPYLLGEEHPSGKRLVNVQNAFRAVDIEEVGDDRHTTFFRMLGNWSLGDYFKREQLPWFFEFLTDKKEGLGLDPSKLYVTVFEGVDGIPKDEESEKIWRELFESKGINPEGRIFFYGTSKNWWSRVGGNLDAMPAGEPGGPDSEVFFDFGETLHPHEKSKFKDQKCHVNCDCGRYWEIGNSVFMQYIKQEDSTFKELPKKNVDFGGGLERLLGVAEEKADMFQTSLFAQTIKIIEKQTQKPYQDNRSAMQIVADHFGASIFIAAAGIVPSNKEQGYVLRRLLRRGLDNFYILGGKDIDPIVETIVEQYKDTDPYLIEKYETIKNTIFEEETVYKHTRENAKQYLFKRYEQQIGRVGRIEIDEPEGLTQISAGDAFNVYQSHGLSPTQIKSLGYEFDSKQFAELMKKHQDVSRAGGVKKFKGGLADTQEQTIRGHTATHLLHQALRDVLGESVHQTGSNITTERVRFDFSYDKKLTEKQIEDIERIVNQKIKENLPVYFKMLPIEEARKLGAIGLFGEKYQEIVKVYFVGPSSPPTGGFSGSNSSEFDVTDMESLKSAYSKEFCGGPHVSATGVIDSFKISKEESLGRASRRIYAIVS